MKIKRSRAPFSKEEVIEHSQLSSATSFTVCASYSINDLFFLSTPNDIRLLCSLTAICCDHHPFCVIFVIIIGFFWFASPLPLHILVSIFLLQFFRYIFVLLFKKERFLEQHKKNC